MGVSGEERMCLAERETTFFQKRPFIWGYATLIYTVENIAWS